MFFLSFYGNDLMNGEANPQLNENISFEGGSLASCLRSGLFPLVGVDWGHYLFSIWVLFVLHLVQTLLD